MRVALDTNVLVSAYLTRGLSADVYRLVLAGFTLVVPEAVFGEFERVMAERFQVPSALLQTYLNELALHERIVTPTSDVEKYAFIRDPDDRAIVASAVKAGASYLVTGDRDVLDVADQIQELRACTPRQFWEAIRSRRS